MNEKYINTKFFNIRGVNMFENQSGIQFKDVQYYCKINHEKFDEFYQVLNIDYMNELITLNIGTYTRRKLFVCTFNEIKEVVIGSRTEIENYINSLKIDII